MQCIEGIDMIQNITVEINVVYDTDYIIFSRVANDEYGHHGYTYEVVMYRPITLADNTVVVNKYAYLNAESKPLYEKRAFGITSFNHALKMADERTERMKWIMDLGMEVVDTELVMEKLI